MKVRYNGDPVFVKGQIVKNGDTLDWEGPLGKGMTRVREEKPKPPRVPVKEDAEEDKTNA